MTAGDPLDRSGGASARSPRPGARLGPLVLEERLGTGASGSVFRARHEALGRACAVKVLHASARDERARRRFERETEALARLAHPGIVRVYAVHHLDGVLACEMQLVEGETLAERLARAGPLPWREAARLVAELARAVQHAHEAGVLHRDLKPENVLLQAADGRPLLADLGIARLTDRSSSLTAAGALLGSPYYMAPEAFEGRPPGPALDVYGLGTVLHAALTGAPPFEAETVQALAAAVCSGACAPTAAPGAPPALEQVRATAMAVDPGARHPTAAALAEDLEALLAGRPPAWAVRARWRRGARRAGLALLLAAGLGVAGGAVAVAARGRGAAPAPAAPPDAGAAAVADLLAAGPAARERGLAAALRLVRQGEAGLAPLERALGAPPVASTTTPPLGLARASVARARGRPVAAGDLAALAGCPPSAELAAVVDHAAEAGVEGPGDVEAARAVLAAHPGPAAARLLALRCWARDDPALRGEAARALAVPGARRGPAARLGAVLDAADAVARALDERAGVDAAAVRLGEALRALDVAERARGLRLALDAATVAVRRALDGGEWEAVDGAKGLCWPLTALDGLGVPLPDRLAALLWFVRTHTEGGEERGRAPRAEALWRMGQALRGEDPLLGAWCLGKALAQGLREPDRDLAALAARVPQAQAAAAAAAPLAGPGLEQALAGISTFAAALEAIGVHEALAAAAGPDGARAHEERAAAYALEAVALAQGRSSSHLRSATKRAARLLARLGRLEEVEPLCAALDAGDAVRAELLRRRGDPAAARALLERALAGRADRPPPDLHGALALALADLGELDAARAALARCEEASRAPGASALALAPFTPAAVREALAGR